MYDVDTQTEVQRANQFVNRRDQELSHCIQVTCPNSDFFIDKNILIFLYLLKKWIKVLPNWFMH